MQEKQKKQEQKGKEEKEIKLQMWQSRYEKALNAYRAELARMDKREALYFGTDKISGAKGAGSTKDSLHTRNIVCEMIDSQAESTIPQPKVTAMKPEDEGKARLIENMIRNELDRLPFEELNDMQERTTPIQGGALILLEWDNTKHTHTTTGSLRVQDLHPQKVIPQDGVYTGIEDMDYIFIRLPQTKKYILRRYGVDVTSESENEPEIKTSGEGKTAEDMVTQIIAYFRNDEGGIGRYSWVCDSVLEDLEDYQARQERVCVNCGMQTEEETCPQCGGKRFKRQSAEYEELFEDIHRQDGSIIPAMTQKPIELPMMGEGMQDGNGQMDGMLDEETGGGLEEMALPMPEPTKIPYYKPKIYPIFLRKNISKFGSFLGDSDVDRIECQQNTIKKLETNIVEKLMKGGSYITLPQGVRATTTDDNLKILRLESAAQKAMIDVYNLQPDISKDMNMVAQVYEEAREVIGITDSFQGKTDSTATSAVAKEFAAQQSAGRLESKRVMKDAQYAHLFEAMFQFMLADADEPRTVVSRDENGNARYDVFDRYDFLEQDEAGEWYWNDRFLFDTDTSSSLAKNRQSLWQEARMNYQQGCYGDPNELDTKIMFWAQMEGLHYPLAGEAKNFLQRKEQQQMEMQQQQMMMQQAQQQAQLGGVTQGQMENISENTAAQAQAADAQAAANAAAVNGGGRGVETV